MSAKELLVRMRDSEGLTRRDRLDWADSLAFRVEQVLAVLKPLAGMPEGTARGLLAVQIVRILNGEE